MIYRIIFSQEEVNGFKRVFEVNDDATFLDLNKALLDSVHYSDDQITSFFLCDDQWERETEIMRLDMGVNNADCITMKEAVVGDLIEGNGQRLVYVFDTINNRYFIGKVSDIKAGKNKEKVTCVESKNDAPVQILESKKKKNKMHEAYHEDDLGEDFYGSDDYDDDDLDMENFQDLSFEDGTMF